MRCSFCKNEIEEGTGTLFVRRDATLDYFCSSKCEKNMLKLKRNPQKVKWIAKAERKKEKKVREMVKTGEAAERKKKKKR